MSKVGNDKAMKSHIEGYKASSFFILLMAVLLFTPLRAIVILIMPAFLLVLYRIQRYRCHKQLNVLLCLYGISSIINLLKENTTIANVLLSSWIVIPLIIFFFSYPVGIGKDIFSKFKFFKNSSLFLLILVDIGGFYCYFFVFQQNVDSFGFLYGLHFNAVHGLSLLNTLICFFFLAKILHEKKINKNVLYLIFFFGSFIFCFFGLGLICMFLSIVLYAIFQFNIKNAVLCLLILTFGVWFVYKYIPDQASYVEHNILNIQEKRKVVSFINYINFIENNPISSLIGVGPGGYNSRSAFLLNEESNNPFTKSLGHQMPPFHQTDAYSLWNKYVASYDDYTDGTANQPFSSLISIFAEYGIIFGVFFYYYYIKNIVVMFKNRKRHFLFLFLFLVDTFMLMSLITSGWLESSEFLCYISFRFLSIAVITQKLKNHTGVAIEQLCQK
jgi:hypothetical protein